MRKKSFNNLVVESCEPTSLGSDIYLLKIRWKRSNKVLPGQFVMLAPAKESSVMARPFSVAVAEYDGKNIYLFIQVVGPNTQLYSTLKEGDRIRISRPLGKPLLISKNDKNFTLVGGGMGIVPLMPLAKNLCFTGKKATALLGFRKSNQLFGKEMFREMGCQIWITAEDKKGNSGLVTDLLEKTLRKEKQPSVIVACGPRAMLKKVAEIAQKHKRKCIVIVEEVMACGTGSCKGCAIFAKDKNAKPKHVCTDGPAFDADWIDWERFSPTCIKVEQKSRPLYSESVRVPLGVTLTGQDGRKLKLKYPILNASGCLGAEALIAERIDLKYAGALVTKGVTLNPRSGNAMPRICEVPYGMLNSIGLENIGVHDFIKTELPIWLSTGKPIIVNVSGFSVDEYGETCQALSGTGIVGEEINVSCPNIDQGQGNKKIFGLDPRLTFDVIVSARISAPKMFLIAKLSPMASDIVEIAKAAKEAGADAISLINTPLGMSIDIHTRKPKIGNVYGGMSGPVVKPMAIRIIDQLFSANLGIPIIGMGGISTGIDAPEFILAGANAVAVGTALFTRSDEIFSEIQTTLEKFVRFHKANNLQELVGKVDK